MQLMRWSITRRLESRGEKQRRDARICQPDTPEARLTYSRCSGEDNDSTTDGEESAGPMGDEAVDLTSARSQHEDEMDDRDPEEPVPEPMPIDLADEEEAEEQESSLNEDEEGSRKRMRICQDAENNNSFVEGGPPAGVFPPAGTSHVTLEALQNTKVAVAQFAATALAGGADSEAALQELAVLQSTLYTLQHQQVFQLQLISQLQQQLSITAQQAPGAPGAPSQTPEQSARSERDDASPPPGPLIHPKPLSSLTSPQHSRPPSHQPPAAQHPSPAATPGQERPPAAASASPLGLAPPPAPGSPGAPAPLAQPTQPTPPASHTVPALCSISSSLASSIITNNDPLPFGHETNSLEMLQKRAQEVLDNASQGLLANNLADELAFRGGSSKGSRLSPYDGKGPGGRSEPFFKHRCRYCGKVFGSDSALQIHIRSHTGERPFKCNVCGSRFTTKGNLKVHFQRHRDKFPHVKMNPNPIPEHLDKYHPPLLQTLAACGQRGLNSPPPPPPPMPPHSSAPGGRHPSPGAPPFPTSAAAAAAAAAFLPPQPPMPLGLALPGALYRSPLLAAGPPPRELPDQDVPENLSKPLPTPSHSPAPSPGAHSNSHHSFNEHCQKQEELVKTEREQSPYQQRPPRPISREHHHLPAEGITPKNEPEDVEEPIEEEPEDFEADPTGRRYVNSSPSPSVHQVPVGHPQMYEDCSMDSKVSGRMETEGADLENEDELDEQPENLSSRANPASMLQQSMQVYPGASPASSSASSGSIQTSFANILFPGLPPHPQLGQSHHVTGNQTSSPAAPPAPGDLIDPARDPAIYSSLLPRPGSNDNSWESLIEITKTSETSKLQQLVDNIEHKLTDPNQCIICQRVLSCKSALQMHYRTHTGERPFKCKICGRAFTTKGNLKTHMGVHRAKPPLRLLHQCTVCHKKFANSFVLQQHVNLHTNGPTELTPEQISAAEVHDFPPGYPPHPLAAFLPQGFPPLHPAGFPLGFPPTARQHAIERQSLDNDMDSKDSLQHHQQMQQHQRYLEEHAGSAEDAEEPDDEEEDRREDDERCEDQRERRSSIDVDEDKEPEPDHEMEHKERLASASPPLMPSFSTSLAALESQVRTITTMASSMAAQQQQQQHHHHHHHHHQQLQHQPPSKSPSSSLHRYNGSEKSQSPTGNPMPAGAAAPLDLTPRASSTPASVSSAPISPPQHHPPHPFGMFAGLLQAVSTSPTTGNMNSVSPGGSAVSPGPGIGALASLTSSAVRAATSTYNPLGLAVGGSAVRGNTTCNICYKTFACNSALEIHYRSHTKERPFKCSICDRGFSTKNADGTRKRGVDRCTCAERARRSAREKARRRRRAEERQAAAARGRTTGGGLAELPGGRGPGALASCGLPPLMPSALGLLASDPVFLGNMKQHMLTHKIRDMPHHLFSDAKPGSGQPSQQQQPPPPPPPQQQQQQQQQQPQAPAPPTSQQQQQQQLLTPPPGAIRASHPLHDHLQQQQRDERSRSPASADESNLPPPSMPPTSQPQPQPQPPSSLDVKKAALPENDLPAPKRPPSMSSKHLCQVCNKNFSSSSALQIHMRTHTGDKPFQCTICQKAFTTKGNLKVHMGTHMWTNGASRRGRRMSLDIPSLPITPKDSEFLQRRPDLFYPYLPAPFLNGMPQKLNEISVIQGSNGLPLPSHPVNASKYAGLFGSVYAAAAGAGFPGANHLDKMPPQQPQSLGNGPLGPELMGPKSAALPAGSLLFQVSPRSTGSPPSPAHSPGTPSSNTGSQNSASIPWAAEAMRHHHHHHFEREAAVGAGDGSPPAQAPPRLPPPPRGEGLAA